MIISDYSIGKGLYYNLLIDNWISFKINAVNRPYLNNLLYLILKSGCMYYKMCNLVYAMIDY